MPEREAWFAGLIDGEGCLTLSIYKQHRHSLRFDLVFCISMKEGNWFAVAGDILRQNEIRFNWRRRKNQIDLRIEGHERVKRLISVVIPYLVVKKPLAEKLLSFPKAPPRNRFVAIDRTYLEQICQAVDFVREFNKGKNRRHKWNRRTISDFYAIV